MVSEKWADQAFPGIGAPAVVEGSHLAAWPSTKMMNIFNSPPIRSSFVAECSAFSLLPGGEGMQ
jgi:hypothetical protein